jgi:hypothetical protein
MTKERAEVLLRTRWRDSSILFCISMAGFALEHWIGGLVVIVVSILVYACEEGAIKEHGLTGEAG